jgi:hypothetical protein
MPSTRAGSIGLMAEGFGDLSRKSSIPSLTDATSRAWGALEVAVHGGTAHRQSLGDGGCDVGPLFE